MWHGHLQLKCVVMYAYATWLFVTILTITMWKFEKKITIKMFTCGKLQVEQTAPCGLFRLSSLGHVR
jgi:hypothetical protein